ncbi:hypothetical protein E3P91_02859 [Wallemia ichthyophaga]|nr:hypothetical protein E3P91_02859 [Wallemia ichthyophaga]
MLDDFVQHPNEASGVKSQKMVDDNGWQSDPNVQASASSQRVPWLTAQQLLEIEHQAPQEAGDGMFELTQVQFTPPSHIVHLTVINNLIYILLESAQILRINLLQADVIDSIQVQVQAISPSARIYADASLRHLLLVDTTVHYIQPDNKRSKQLPKMSKLTPSCVHFVNSRQSLSSALVLAGTAEGSVYQAVINPNPSDIFRKNSEERHLKQLFSFNEPIVEINSHVYPDRKSALAIVVTRSRLYTFIGPFGKIDNDGGVGLETVFSQSPFSIKITDGADAGAHTHTLESHASFYYNTTNRSPHTHSPRALSWLCDRSLYNAWLDTETRNAEKVCAGATLTEVEGGVRGVLLTAYHCLCLYNGAIKAYRILDGAVVWDEQIPKGIRGMARDNFHHTLWLYSDDAIYELTITDEDRDIWKVHLCKRDFEKALRSSKSAVDRDVILGKEADLYFAQGKFIQSAQIYAQSTSKPFESVVLQFVEVDERDALRYYLSARLERSKKTELTQRMMLATWLLEIYLDKLNQLDDLISENTNEDAENARMELEMMMDDVKVFIKTYKQNLDKNVVYKSLKLHARLDLLLEFATCIDDYKVILEQHSYHCRWRDILHVLAGQSDLELHYKYAPRLLREATQHTVEIWKREPRLDLKRLIPSLIQCEKLSKESRMHATKYMEWKFDYDSVDEPIAYNVYITLLSKDEEREEELVEYLKRTTTARFDMDFALRLFHKRGLKRATIQMYALMELFDSSVDLAIESGDLDLATVYADKPADDPILRKKLWLRIAKVIVQDRRDIKSAMQFLEGSDVLQLEDILPFFPSFEVVDDFKEEICNALDRYSSRIEQLSTEMDETGHTSQRIKGDMDKLKDRKVVVAADEKCAISGKAIRGSEFYVFPTQRVYRVDALIEKVATYAKPETLRRIVELQAEIEGVKNMHQAKPTKAGFSGERLRELVVPSTINQIFNTNNKTSKRKDVVKLRKELDEILSKSDPLVEESVVNVDKPFRRNEKISTIALALGPERTRDELIPFLQDSLDDEDEVLLALAEELGSFTEYVGGKEYAHVTLSPLESLAGMEETLVRDKASESINKIATDLSSEQVETHYLPLLQRLTNGDWFTPRTSACALFASVYQTANESTRNELRGLFKKLTNDDTPMVRRSAAKNLAGFINVLEPNEIFSEFIDVYKKLAIDDQDSVRLLTVEALITIMKKLDKSQVNSELLPCVRAACNDASWRVRFMVGQKFVEMAECVNQDIIRDELVQAFVNLLKDNEAEVRTASASQIPGVAKFVDQEIVLAKILPVVRDIAGDQSQHVRAAVANELSGLAPLLVIESVNTVITMDSNEVITLDHAEPSHSSSPLNRLQQSPSHSSLGVSKLLSLPAINLSLHSSIVFLHPRLNDNNEDDDGSVSLPPPSSEDEDVIRGVVELYLPSSRKIHGIEVRLIGSQCINFPSGAYETFPVLDKFVEIDKTYLEKGTHKFEFSIIIPSSTPGYERCAYGRVYYYVRAKAISAGPLGFDLTDSREVLLVINPNPEGEPSGLSWHHDQIIDGLGAMSIDVESTHLTIGGPVHLRLHLHEPPKGATLHCINVSLLQYITLRNRDRSKEEKAPAVAVKFFQLGSRKHEPLLSPYEEVDEDGWKHEWIGRLPDDDHARPSTVKTNKTSIIISHQLLVQIFVTPSNLDGEHVRDKDDKSQMKVISIRRPIFASSCCVSLDSITLPAYEEVAPSQDVMYECACGQPLKSLIAKETAVPQTGSGGVMSMSSGGMHGGMPGTSDLSNALLPIAQEQEDEEKARLANEDGRQGRTHARFADNYVTPFIHHIAMYRTLTVVTVTLT